MPTQPMACFFLCTSPSANPNLVFSISEKVGWPHRACAVSMVADGQEATCIYGQESRGQGGASWKPPMRSHKESSVLMCTGPPTSRPPAPVSPAPSTLDNAHCRTQKETLPAVFGLTKKSVGEGLKREGNG